MAEVTKIQWTTHTFNPWIGCTKVAPGCQHCYAEADMDKRKGRVKWGPNGTRSRTTDAYWKQPLKWNREAGCNCHARRDLGEKHLSDCPQANRPRVFCASLADVFEDWGGRIIDSKGHFLHRCCQCGNEWAADFEDGAERAKASLCKECFATDYETELTMADCRRDLFALIDATPNLDWLLLTKRPENIRRMWCSHVNTDGSPPSQLHRPNVWLGTSISDQATANKAIPELLKCRDLSPVLFLSIEPLLGPVEFSDVSKRSDAVAQLGKKALNGIDWVIVGGESGQNARPRDCHRWETTTNATGQEGY